MNAADVDQALATAEARGFLTLDEAPTDPASEEMKRVHDAWNERCATLSRHRVAVFPALRRDSWCVVIAFAIGPDAELAYVRKAIADVFRRHLGRDPNTGDPEAWYAQHDDRGTLEALAAELVAIDVEPRDARLETLFVVHDL